MISPSKGTCEMADDILDQARSYLERLPADSPEWQGRIAEFLSALNRIAEGKSAERKAAAFPKVEGTEHPGPLDQHVDGTAQKHTSEEWTDDTLAALAALRRAAIKARRRAIETTGSVATWRDGKIVYDTEV